MVRAEVDTVARTFSAGAAAARGNPLDARAAPWFAALMRRIVYAGGTFYTGDAIAEALLEYARALARQGTADTVFVPSHTAEGDTGATELLIGPASQLVSEPVDLAGDDLTDEGLVERLRDLTARLQPLRPEAQRADEIDLSDDVG